MMKQYREARKSLEPDTRLLFRLGILRERSKDGKRDSLGITLLRGTTCRWQVPFHAACLLDQTFEFWQKVAICDQLRLLKQENW